MQNMPLERKLFLPACLYVLMRTNMLQWRSWNVLNAYVFCFSPFYVLHYFVACFSSRCFMLSSFLPYFFPLHSFYFLKFSFYLVCCCCCICCRDRPKLTPFSFICHLPDRDICSLCIKSEILYSIL